MGDFGYLIAQISQPGLPEGFGRHSLRTAITFLRAGERVTVEPAGEGELRVRRAALGFEDAFGVLTGIYPPDNLDQLDAEDAER